VVTTGEIDFILLAYGKNLFLRQTQVFASPVFTVEKTVFSANWQTCQPWLPFFPPTGKPANPGYQPYYYQ